MPELVPPGWVSSIKYQNPGETFLSAYFAATQANARRQQMENAMARLGLENQRLNMSSDQNQRMYELRLQAMNNAATAQATANQIRQGSIENQSQHWKNMADIGEETNRVKDERTKLWSEKVGAQIANEAERTTRQRAINFWSEAGTKPGGLGLPADAFQNTDIKTDDSMSQGWHKDPKKPDYRYYNKPIFDNDGKPVTDPSTGKQVIHPITIHDNTFNRLKNTYDDLSAGGPTSRQVAPQDTTVTQAPAANTRIIERDGKRYEVDDATKTVLREIQ